VSKQERTQTSTLTRFQPEELERFLREVDRQLSAPTQIVIIGGAVVGMLYDPEHSTTDIDLFDAPKREVLDALDRARSVSGLAIPVNAYSGDADQ
jgi:hypothetical protein